MNLFSDGCFVPVYKICYMLSNKKNNNFFSLKLLRALAMFCRLAYQHKLIKLIKHSFTLRLYGAAPQFNLFRYYPRLYIMNYVFQKIQVLLKNGINFWKGGNTIIG